MNHPWIALLALAVAGGAVWFLLTRGEAPRSGPAITAAPPAAEELSLATLELPRPSEPQAADTPAQESPAPAPPAGRAPVRTQREEELARAHWVEGRVLLPPGTPADEELFVVADGKDFTDGSDHRARVAPDGSFRVAFSEKSRSGRIGIEGRYLYLEKMERWKRGLATTIVLRPQLGARLVVRLVPPAGFDPRSIVGRVELTPVPLADVSRDRPVIPRDLSQTAKGSDLAHTFDALRPEYTYHLDYTGDDLASDHLSIDLGPGDSRSLDLELVRGVTLSGRVLDESGTPLADAHAFANSEGDLQARSRHRGTRSAADGSFTLRALLPGRIRLYAEMRGHQDAELDVGPLAEGESRTSLALVLRRGRVISGRVVFPDGRPASAVVYVASSVGEGHWDATISGIDGWFRLSGLHEEAYEVTACLDAEDEEASGADQLPRWQARVEDVPAGTEDLLLTLSEGEELELRVRDENGGPVTACTIQGKWITHRSSDPGGPELQFSSRGESQDGSYRVGRLVAGEWEISVTARGFGPCPAQTVTVPATRTLAFVLANPR